MRRGESTDVSRGELKRTAEGKVSRKDAKTATTNPIGDFLCDLCGFARNTSVRERRGGLVGGFLVGLVGLVEEEALFGVGDVAGAHAGGGDGDLFPFDRADKVAGL